MLIRAAAIWLVLMVLAIANGVTRNALITPRVGEHAGHVISTVILCGLIFLAAWLAIDWIGPGGARQAFFVGVLWVGMTAAFEFLVGHYVFGHSWEKLLADYNLARGRVWILVLLSTLLAPYVAARARGQ